jgi:hypothetical protein
MSILQKNKYIKIALSNKLKERGLRKSDVVKEANAEGINITNAKLSNYFKYNIKKGMPYLTEKDIMWLCLKFSVSINILVE